MSLASLATTLCQGLDLEADITADRIKPAQQKNKPNNPELEKPRI